MSNEPKDPALSLNAANAAAADGVVATTDAFDAHDQAIFPISPGSEHSEGDDMHSGGPTHPPHASAPTAPHKQVRIHITKKNTVKRTFETNAYFTLYQSFLHIHLRVFCLKCMIIAHIYVAFDVPLTLSPLLPLLACLYSFDMFRLLARRLTSLSRSSTRLSS